jgi:hypothetical protein
MHISEYAIKVSHEAINGLLRQHEECIAKRGATYMQS